MAKIKINDNSGSDDTSKVVSPTQSQMDEWVATELAEAPADNMLADDAGVTFPDTGKESSNGSMD